MNIYEIVNEYNKKHNLLPWRYIGSDIKDRQEYFGSSKTLTMDIIKLGKEWFSKQILWRGDQTALHELGVKHLTELERKFHLKFNVVKDPTFYNRCYAGERFTTEGQANYYYKNDEHKKLIVLPRNHPDVVAGLVVGQHSGTKRKYSSDRNKKISEALKKKFSSGDFRIKGFNVGPKSETCKQRMRKPKTETHKKNIKAALHERLQDPKYRQKLSATNGRRTRVNQYDLKGNFLKQYSTIKEAAESIGGGNKRCDISACCRGKQQTAYGYVWSYASIKNRPIS